MMAIVLSINHAFVVFGCFVHILLQCNTQAVVTRLRLLTRPLLKLLCYFFLGFSTAPYRKPLFSLEWSSVACLALLLCGALHLAADTCYRALLNDALRSFRRRQRAEARGDDPLDRNRNRNRNRGGSASETGSLKSGGPGAPGGRRTRRTRRGAAWRRRRPAGPDDPAAASNGGGGWGAGMVMSVSAWRDFVAGGLMVGSGGVGGETSSFALTDLEATTGDATDQTTDAGDDDTDGTVSTAGTGGGGGGGGRHHRWGGVRGGFGGGGGGSQADDSDETGSTLSYGALSAAGSLSRGGGGGGFGGEFDYEYDEEEAPSLDSVGSGRRWAALDPESTLNLAPRNRRHAEPKTEREPDHGGGGGGGGETEKEEGRVRGGGDDDEEGGDEGRWREPPPSQSLEVAAAAAYGSRTPFPPPLRRQETPTAAHYKAPPTASFFGGKDGEAPRGEPAELAGRHGGTEGADECEELPPALPSHLLSISPPASPRRTIPAWIAGGESSALPATAAVAANSDGEGIEGRRRSTTKDDESLGGGGREEEEGQQQQEAEEEEEVEEKPLDQHHKKAGSPVAEAEAGPMPRF